VKCTWLYMKMLFTGFLNLVFIFFTAAFQKLYTTNFVTFFGDKIMMTSLKWSRNLFFIVQFCHNQFETPQFSQIMQLQAFINEGKGGSGSGEPPTLGNFWRFVTKIMHFRHISAKIQPKNLNLVYYQFLAVRGNILIGKGPDLLGSPLATHLVTRYLL